MTDTISRGANTVLAQEQRMIDHALLQLAACWQDYTAQVHPMAVGLSPTLSGDLYQVGHADNLRRRFWRRFQQRGLDTATRQTVQEVYTTVQMLNLSNRLMSDPFWWSLITPELQTAIINNADTVPLEAGCYTIDSLFALLELGERRMAEPQLTSMPNPTDRLLYSALGLHKNRVTTALIACGHYINR